MLMVLLVMVTSVLSGVENSLGFLTKPPLIGTIVVPFRYGNATATFAGRRQNAKRAG